MVVAGSSFTTNLFGRLTSFFSKTSKSVSSKASANFLTKTDKQALALRREIFTRERTAVSMDDKSTAMETYYLNHGNPMVPFSDMPLKDFLIGLGKSMERPKAFLVISAHWDTKDPVVTMRNTNTTYHDFYGFPPFVYKLRYDAPGSIDLSKRIIQLLKGKGFPSAKEDSERGLDHGVWVPLMLMNPDADIPVVQLSIQCKKDGIHHYRMGQALAPLTKEGVCIIGSGTATHNMRSLSMRFKSTPPWAAAFDEWLTTSLADKRYDELIHWEEKAPYAKVAHPTPDHFLPLLVALGAAGDNATSKLINHGWELMSFSMACFEFQHGS